MNTLQWIEKAKNIHGNTYDYKNSLYVNSKTKINVICYIHGNFKVNPYDHITNKSKCPKCSGCGKYENPLDFFIERAKLKHNNVYNYDKFKYINAKTKSIIICPEHGEFLQHANNHLSGKGCPGCRGKKISTVRLSKGKTDKEILDNLHIIHDNKYEYPNQIFNKTNNKWKIKVICKIHGEFKQLFLSHYYRGNGCEKCGNNKLSKGEARIESFFMKNNIEHIREKIFDNCINPKTNRKLPFDFYLPKYNICIEYDGKQHFEENTFYKIDKIKLEEIILKDRIKEKFCRENNINLIRISYLNFSKIENILCNLI